MMRAAAWAIALGCLTTSAAAQLPNQSFQVVPEVRHATVGDPVTLDFLVRLDAEDLLYDTVPKPTAALRDGVRILSTGRLQREPDRTYRGQAQVAFYRTGRQAVPIFGLPFMRGVKGMTRGMLTSDSAFVEIDSILPPGEPPLKDIRDVVRPRWPGWRSIAVVLAVVLAIIAALIVRRRKPKRSAVSAERALPPIVREPYDEAVARLAEIEREEWPAHGETDRHYDAVADTLRRYLEETGAVPALTRTTGELMRALSALPPPHDLQQRWGALLGAADRVKFAGERPGPATAEAFLDDARGLLERWQAAASITDV